MNLIQSQNRLCAVLAAFLPLAFAAFGAGANTLSVTLDLANLPSSITLCRDPTAVQAFYLDEQWQIGIDVDGNSSTGSDGVDVLLLAETNTPTPPCSPTTAPTQTSLVAAMAIWDNAVQQFVATDTAVTLNVDLSAHTLTLSTDVSGPLGKLSGQSQIYAAAIGSYTPSSGPPTIAYDNASPIGPSGSTTDPTGDVQQCAAPCSAAASWYPLIDLTGVSATTSEPLAMFGANTVFIEFDVASLPSSMSLCRFPSAMEFADSDWAAFINVDGNTNTGLSGFDAIVEVYTALQEPSCLPNSVPLDQALQADAGHWDDTLQNFVQDEVLTAYADATTGKIVVQADRSQAPLTGLSSMSTFGMQTEAFYPSGNSPPFAYDVLGLTTFGLNAVGPSGDVQNCIAACSPAVSWYDQIDLVGGSVHLQNEVFSDSFE